MNRPISTQNSVNRLILRNLAIVQSILMGFWKGRAHKAAASCFYTKVSLCAHLPLTGFEPVRVSPPYFKYGLYTSSSIAASQEYCAISCVDCYGTAP